MSESRICGECGSSAAPVVETCDKCGGPMVTACAAMCHWSTYHITAGTPIVYPIAEPQGRTAPAPYQYVGSFPLDSALAERARIVAWLRAGAPGVDMRHAGDYIDETLADAIERGEHERSKP